jgi:hypothetical protein
MSCNVLIITGQGGVIVNLTVTQIKLENLRSISSYQKLVIFHINCPDKLTNTVGNHFPQIESAYSLQSLPISE